MRSILMCAGVAALFATGGCATTHHAKAEYHEAKAEQAWDRGHPVKAAKEKAKEVEERHEEHHHD